MDQIETVGLEVHRKIGTARLSYASRWVIDAFLFALHGSLDRAGRWRAVSLLLGFGALSVHSFVHGWYLSPSLSFV